MYKKHILLLAAIFGTLALKAQTNKGDQFIGGSTNFVNTNETTQYFQPNTSLIDYTQTQKTKLFSIGPAYSYFIANNLDVAINTGYSHQKTIYTYTNSNQPYNPRVADNGNDAYVNLSLRKYFLYDNKIGIRAGLLAEYEYFNVTTSYQNQALNPNDYYNVKFWGSGLTFDLVYLPYKRLGLASRIGFLGYNHQDNMQNYSHDTTNTFGWVVNSGLNLSVFYCFK